MGITEISDAKSWEVDVINSNIPVFVDFWAEWCGPCRMVGPVVEELANDYDGKVSLSKLMSMRPMNWLQNTTCLVFQH